MYPNTYAIRAALMLALLVLGTVACGQVGVAGERRLDSASVAAIERFSTRIAADVENDGVGGIAAGIVNAHSLIWAEAFGVAERESGAPARVDGVYRTGSISKTFTAVLLLQLVEEGLVGLDDKVVDHLPEFADVIGSSEHVASITLRQLASHTSGLMREPALENAAAGPIEGWEKKVLASIPATSLQSEPGSEYSYSNIGFGILGLTLSRAAGEPFMDLVKRLTFEPLGMASSTFVVGAGLAPRLATGYENRNDTILDGELPALEHAGRGYKVPNGGVYSTVVDLAEFIRGLSGTSESKVLSESSRAEMFRWQTPAGGRGYGLGLSITVTEDGLMLLGHGGSVAGYTAHLKFEPETGLGVILLRNYGRGETNLGDAATQLLAELVAVEDASSIDHP